ncbi:ABC transporter permease subunit [Geoglobus acetivorans]|uniref:Branched-chain amino acid ABC transporter permease n=1 Tax=Geoglobus acetivorans TaxID=565033 RepID=A0ABZ3H3W4_GEOAI|nr:branched-chain amino acid ABC transporter permease [Geoglobus acetivorans]
MALETLISSILLWFGIYSIIALSLNIEYGYGGIPNFGKALAVLIGAFTAGAIVNRILISVFSVKGSTITQASGFMKSVVDEVIAANPVFGIGLLLFSLALAGLVGAVIGGLFILPSAKLESDYLAITLLAIAEIMFMIAYNNTALVGGYYGAPVPDVLAFVSGSVREWVFVGLILFFALLTYLFLERALNSPYGRLLRAMREDAVALQFSGKDIMWVRIKTLAFSSAVASMAGVLYSYYAGNVIGIVNLFARVNWTFYPFLMVLLGGISNNRGVLAGVMSFVVIWRLLDGYKHEIASLLNLPFDVNWLQYIIFGVLMIVILYYRPEGLIKEKPIETEPLKDLRSKRSEKA